jgi:hypothetical protein
MLFKNMKKLNRMINVWKPYATKEKMFNFFLIIHVCQRVDECVSYEKWENLMMNKKWLWMIFYTRKIKSKQNHHMFF